MLLGIDLGTTYIKALVTDLAGRRLGAGACLVELFHVGAGGVEQDIEEIWKATLTAIREAVRLLDPSGIQAIGVSSQGGAMQLLDAQGRPSGRVISWLDQRGRSNDDALTAKLGTAWFGRRIGHSRSGLAVGQLLRLRQEQPDLLAAPNRVGFVGDVIVSRLCGRAGHDGTSCGLTGLYNATLRDYDSDLLARLGVTVAQLPALVSPREPAGGLLPAIAQATGLRGGIPVSVAIHDQYAAALATRAVIPGTAMVGAGTAWVLLAVSEHPTQPVTECAFVCRHVVEGLWGQIVSLVNGGSAFKWALELTGHAGRGAAEVDRLLESAPPGCEGLQCWPFLTAFGASRLAPNTGGRLSGLQLSHRPGHVVRSVLEGLAFELKRHLGFLREAGLPIERLVLGGSASASRVTPQLIADVTGLPLACADAGEGSPLGAAIIAHGLLEPTTGLADLARKMAPAVRDVAPGPGTELYQEQFPQYLHSLPLAQPSSP